MRARRVPRWLAVAAIAALATGCGATLEDDPRTIDRDDVPFGLLDEPSGEDPGGEDPDGAPSSTTTTRAGPPPP